MSQVTYFSIVINRYLLEVDTAYYASETSWFKLKSGRVCVVKSPEYATKDEMKYISEYMQKVEDAIMGNGYDKDNDKELSDYVDIDSYAKFYMMELFTGDHDVLYSSTYFYKDKNSKLYAGPLWDFDNGYGLVEGKAIYYVSNNVFLRQDLRNLMKYQPFKNCAKEYYLNNLYPLISSLVSKNEAGTVTLDEIYNKLLPSIKMDEKLWYLQGKDGWYEDTCDYVKNRGDWIIKYLEDGEYSLIYNNEEYIKYNPQIAEYVDVNNKDEVYEYFFNYGMALGQRSSEAFDVKMYMANYPDLVLHYGDNFKSYYEHYLMFGCVENRVADRYLYTFDLKDLDCKIVETDSFKEIENSVFIPEIEILVEQNKLEANNDYSLSFSEGTNENQMICNITGHNQYFGELVVNLDIRYKGDIIYSNGESKCVYLKVGKLLSEQLSDIVGTDFLVEGWYEDASFTKSFDINIMPFEDMKLYVKEKRKQDDIADGTTATSTPANEPTNVATSIPANEPTNIPTSTPTNIPTSTPTNIPTSAQSTPTMLPLENDTIENGTTNESGSLVEKNDGLLNNGQIITTNEPVDISVGSQSNTTLCMTNSNTDSQSNTKNSILSLQKQLQKLIEENKSAKSKSNNWKLKAKRKNNNQVQLTWKKQKNVDGYVVYYKYGTKDYKKIAITKKTAVCLKNKKIKGEKYKFLVLSYKNIEGNKSAISISNVVTCK